MRSISTAPPLCIKEVREEHGGVAEVSLVNAAIFAINPTTTQDSLLQTPRDELVELLKGDVAA